MYYLALGLTCLLTMFAATLPGEEPEKKKGAGANAADLKSFREFLAKKFSGKKWQTGPSRLEGKEIEAAYGKRRFYFVFSAPPLPPGANLPELIEAFQKRSEEYRRDYLSLTVSIDEEGTITPLQKPADFNKGLMKVENEKDAKVAAAAILSLFGSGRVGPGPVSAKDVTVTREGQGWSCRVETRNYQGIVVFDGAGRCTNLSKSFIGPVPS